MENSIYTVDYFIKKFEAIPERLVITRALHDENGGHCSLGWCLENNGHRLTAESVSLQSVLGFVSIADINNGDDPKYQQPTAKQRILAALYEAYEKTYGRKYQAEPELKERIVYVMVDSTVKELSGQLTNN